MSPPGLVVDSRHEAVPGVRRHERAPIANRARSPSAIALTLFLLQKSVKDCSFLGLPVLHHFSSSNLMNCGAHYSLWARAMEVVPGVPTCSVSPTRPLPRRHKRLLPGGDCDIVLLWSGTESRIERSCPARVKSVAIDLLRSGLVLRWRRGSERVCSWFEQKTCVLHLWQHYQIVKSWKNRSLWALAYLSEAL